MSYGDRPASPFAPEGVGFTPVHPNLTKVRLIVAVGCTAPFLFICVVLALLLSQWAWWIPAGVLAAVLIWLIWLIPRQVRALGYAEAAEDLLIRRGIMWRSLVVVPYGRMQHIDVEAGPLDRYFGIAKVKLHTASATTDATLSGLRADEAGRLREALTTRGEARLAGL